MKTIRLLDATEENFKAFGWLIREPGKVCDIESEYVKYWDRLVSFNSFIKDLNLGFLICKKQPPICHKMETLPNVQEAYICLDREAAVFFVALDTNSSPAISKINAFLLKGSSVVLHRGIWHWSPFPLRRDSNYAILTSENCLVSKRKRVFINPDQVIVRKLAEPVTVEIKANNQ